MSHYGHPLLPRGGGRGGYDVPLHVDVEGPATMSTCSPRQKGLAAAAGGGLSE